MENNVKVSTQEYDSSLEVWNKVLIRYSGQYLKLERDKDELISEKNLKKRNKRLVFTGYFQHNG